MRPGLCSIALLATGCAQLVGIDGTSGDGRLDVTMAVERISVGTTVIRAPQDLSANVAEYLVPDAADPTVVTRVPATQTEVGVWTADLDVTPPLLFDLPEVPGPPVKQLWTFPVRDQLAGLIVLEHPGPTAADPAAMFTVNVALERPYSSESFELFIVGAWENRGLEVPIAGAGALTPPPFAMSSMSSLVGRPLEKITTDDAPVVLRRNGTKLDGVFEVPPFDQTGADAITGSITAVAAIDTLDIQLDPAAIANRISAANPDVSAPSFSWELDASPGAAEIGSTLGPRLESGAVTTETTVNVTYGNPFEAKWPTTFTFRANSTRSATLDAALPPVTLIGGMVHVDNKPTAAQVIDLPVRFPQVISIDGNALLLDNQTIAAPTAPIEVTLVTDNTDKALSLFQLDVIEIVPSADGTVFEQHRVLSAFAAEPTLKLPADVLQAGKRYTLRVILFAGGFPNAAAGDLRTRGLPITAAFLDSGVFQVTP